MIGHTNRQTNRDFLFINILVWEPSYSRSFLPNQTRKIPVIRAFSKFPNANLRQSNPGYCVVIEQTNRDYYLYNKTRHMHICLLCPAKRLDWTGWNFLLTLMWSLGVTWAKKDSNFNLNFLFFFSRALQLVIYIIIEVWDDDPGTMNIFLIIS